MRTVDPAIFAGDPPVREDGKCVVCLKDRKPERSKRYAGITAELDPFCSNIDLVEARAASEAGGSVSRFVVTEIEGFIRPVRGGVDAPGLSCHVIDTMWNRQLVRSFRTEDPIYNGKKRDYKRLLVREQSQRLAAELNGLLEAA